MVDPPEVWLGLEGEGVVDPPEVWLGLEGEGVVDRAAVVGVPA